MRQVVPPSGQAYRRKMPAAFFLRFLTMLALFAMPLGMIPGVQAVAKASAAASAGHCAEMTPQADGHRPALPQPDHSADCAIACSALPSIGGTLSPPDLPPALRQPPAVLPAGVGLHPEAATPPPRLI